MGPEERGLKDHKEEGQKGSELTGTKSGLSKRKKALTRRSNVA